MTRASPLPFAFTAFLAVGVLLMAAVPLLFLVEVDCRPCWGTGKAFASYFPACTACETTGKVRLSRGLVQRLDSASEKAGLPRLSYAR